MHLGSAAHSFYEETGIYCEVYTDDSDSFNHLFLIDNCVYEFSHRERFYVDGLSYEVHRDKDLDLSFSLVESPYGYTFVKNSDIHRFLYS